MAARKLAAKGVSACYALTPRGRGKHLKAAGGVLRTESRMLW